MNQSPNAPAAFRPGRYAAIDIGTVTARLLIADVEEDGTMRELHKDRSICNLGAGVDKTGRLDADAMARVREAVARFTASIERNQAESGVPVAVTANATSASRDAANASEFVSMLHDLGVELAVIPGTQEAALSFAGATSAFPGGKTVVADIGGGSTEIIAGPAGGVPQFAHSFDIGCRRVTERYFESDPPTASQLAAAARWIADTMRGYVGTVTESGYAGSRFIAVAGTATSVISMRERMVPYDPLRVHGATASRADVAGLLERLSTMTLSEREQVEGLDPGRAPVIVAGLLILQQVMELLGADSFTASERDILHGIILGAASA